MTKTNMRPPRRQRGVVLIVSLIFLMVLTVIGVTAMQTTTLQERMSGNLRDGQAAFQAAEAALRQGESQLQGALVPSYAYHYQNDPAPDWAAAATWSGNNTNIREYTGMDFTAGDQALSANPQFFLEEMRAREDDGGSLEAGVPVGETAMIRIVAWGVGSNEETTAILESRYMR